MKKLLGFICCVVACTMFSITTTGCQKKAETKKAGDKAEKTEKTEKTETGKGDKTEKTEKTEKVEKTEKTPEVTAPPKADEKKVDEKKVDEKKESSFLNAITPSHASIRIVRESSVAAAVLARRNSIS